MAFAPVVLVVDDDESARRLVRLGLELEGATVLDADSLDRARALIDTRLAAVVLDRELPDGDGLLLLPDLYRVVPDVRVVIHSTKEDGHEPASIPRVDKGDVEHIVALLDLGTAPARDPQLAIVDLVRHEAGEIVMQWTELCRWDPILPPDSLPPHAAAVVAAVSEAVRRPQPIGWGPDPAVQRAVEVFALSVGDIDDAVAQLICLREALHRRVTGRVPPDEVAESHSRVDMVVDRAIWVAAKVAAGRLRNQAMSDPLTALGNRRLFDQTLQREMARSRRHDRPLSVVMFDLDELKRVNDEHGHPAGDRLLRSMAGALAGLVREHDAAFRVGGDEFALILPETGAPGAQRLVDRLERLGAPALSYGIAEFPVDARTPDDLVAEADRRLFEDKREKGPRSLPWSELR